MDPLTRVWLCSGFALSRLKPEALPGPAGGSAASLETGWPETKNSSVTRSGPSPPTSKLMPPLDCPAPSVMPEIPLALPPTKSDGLTPGETL